MTVRRSTSIVRSVSLHVSAHPSWPAWSRCAAAAPLGRRRRAVREYVRVVPPERLQNYNVFFNTAQHMLADRWLVSRIGYGMGHNLRK